MAAAHPLLLFLILPPRTRLWGLAWMLLFGVLTLAVWPQVIRQLELVINFGGLSLDWRRFVA